MTLFAFFNPKTSSFTFLQHSSPKTHLSLLQDPYENMYAVIRGTKSFTLLPPCDAYRLYVQQCPVAKHEDRRSGELELVREEPARVRTLHAIFHARSCFF